MPRKQEPNSVATIVGLLLVGNDVKIENKTLESVSVMVSQLKRREEHKDKKFKVKQVDGVIIVTRVI
jgi:hypothetical protein